MSKDPRDEKRSANAIRATIIIGCTAAAAFWMTAAIPVPASGEEPVSKSPPLKCHIGPVTKTFGMTQWLVYSCDDRRSLVIVSAPGNPAMPFYFMFYPRQNGYRLSGEGSGRKDATAAAFEELKALSHRDIIGLIEETKQQ